METDAGNRWREQLAGWAIPDEILRSAERPPWEFPPECFSPSSNPPTPATTERCTEALDGGVVLDVGVGGGRASLHLPATEFIGVDAGERMLRRATDEAERRGVPFEGILGEWPAIAPGVPLADVVVSAHVVYNVPPIEDFVAELAGHARRRVVVELDDAHPMTRTREPWHSFWGLDRPAGPTADDFLAVLASIGITPEVDVTEIPAHKAEVTPEEVARLRIRICLPADRDPEVEAFLRSAPREPRRVRTVWWDTA